jgi:putative flavoprotein involved in K+ transport
MSAGNGTEATRMTGLEHHDAIVVGGGQAGLAASHHLARRGIEHVVLDAGPRTGDAWRTRWDSLRLFTPAAMNGLPGTPFPAAPSALPTKDEMADYLAAYASDGRLPVRHAVRVERLDRGGDGYLLEATDHRYTAREVIVATGFLSAAWTPALARDVDPSIPQLHSDRYRDPASITGDRVLVVGSGNSGVELALELASAGRRVTLAGHGTFLPRIAHVGGGRPFFAFARRALTLDTPIGRRMHARMGDQGTAPVIRVRPGELAAAGVERVSRVTAIRNGRPVLADGRVIETDTILWCTGFRPAFDWIRLPVLASSGLPRHDRGVVADAPGLSFVGLPFQSGFLSALVGGVGADADRIAGGIAARLGQASGRLRPAGTGAAA